MMTIGAHKAAMDIMWREYKGVDAWMYRLKYRDNINARQRAWKSEHKEKIKAQGQAYYLRHRERILSTCAAYRAANPEKRKAVSLGYYYANKNKALASVHRYYQANKEHLAECKKNWLARNPDARSRYETKRRARKLNCVADPDADAFYGIVRSKAKVRCYYCGKVMPGKKAHIDHIIPLSVGGSHSLGNLCTSCPTCNLSKHAKLPAEITTTNQPLLNI